MTAPSEYADLIARLRDPPDVTHTTSLRHQAADALEQQAKRVGELEREVLDHRASCERYCKEVSDHMHKVSDERDALQARLADDYSAETIRTLRAKLAEAERWRDRALQVLPLIPRAGGTDLAKFVTDLLGSTMFNAAREGEK